MDGGCYRSSASCKQAWPGVYSFDGKSTVPGADYLTQIIGIEQTVIGRGVCTLKIAGFRSREQGIDHD